MENTDSLIISFENSLNSDLNGRVFYKANLEDVPFIMLSQIGVLSRNLLAFKNVYQQTPSIELASCINDFKTTIQQLLEVVSTFISRLEKNNNQVFTNRESQDIDTLLNECGDRYNKTFEEKSAKIREAGSFIDRIKEVGSFGKSFYNDTKWCTEQIIERGIKGKIPD